MKEPLLMNYFILRRIVRNKSVRSLLIILLLLIIGIMLLPETDIQQEELLLRADYSQNWNNFRRFPLIDLN